MVQVCELEELRREVEELKRELEELRKFVNALDEDLEEVKEWARDEYEIREIAHEVAEKVAREIAEGEIFRWVKRESLYY